MHPVLRTAAAAVLVLPIAACCWGKKESATSGSTAAASDDGWPTMPVPGEAPAWEPPKAESFTLANGIPVRFVQTGSVPLAHVQINLHRGYQSEPADKRGLAAFTADLLNEGAGERSALELDEALQTLASNIDLGAGGHHSYAKIDSLEANLDATLAIAADILAAPTLGDDDIQRVRDDRKNRILTEKDDLRTTANKVFFRTLFGDEGPGRWSRGTAESLDRITKDDVKAWHRDVWQPSNAGIVVVARQDRDTVQSILERHFGDWQAAEGAALPARAEPAVTKHAGVKVHWVHHPGASQSAVYVGNTAGAFEPARSAARAAGNSPLGGQFTSRINMNLREDKGYTYGARSSLSNGLYGGWFYVSTSVKAGTTALALSEILRELKEIVGERPITDEEFTASIGRMLQGRPGRFEQMGGVLGQFAAAEALQRPDDWIATYTARVAAVTRDAAQAELAEAVDPGNLVVLIVGDLEADAQVAEGSEAMTIAQAVGALGLGDIVRLDHEGAPEEVAK